MRVIEAISLGIKGAMPASESGVNWGRNSHILAGNKQKLCDIPVEGRPILRTTVRLWAAKTDSATCTWCCLRITLVGRANAERRIDASYRRQTRPQPSTTERRIIMSFPSQL